MMKKEETKKIKYSTPTVQVMEFAPGCILAGSVGPGGWSIDVNSLIGGTGASSGGWSIDGDSGGGGTGASSGGWSVDDGDSGGGTGASTGSWSTN
jgi:hypothetical protein